MSLRRLTRFLDGALDGAVAAFALWTVIYEVALAGRWSLWAPAAVWAVAAAGLVLGAGLLEVRRRSSEDSAPVDHPPVDHPPVSTMHPLVLVGAVAALFVTVSLRDRIGVWPVALVAAVLLVEGLRRLLQRSPSTDDRSERARTEAGWESWLALAACVGLAVFASLLRRPDDDDVYYVNRSLWVQEHGVPALRDTMFGPEMFPSAYGGGLPLPSVESLFGALAHLAGMRAGTLTYFVAVPLLAFLAGWASWRLVRAWAPRRAFVAFGLSLAVAVLGDESVLGSYSVGRIWQGKVIAFAVLSPVIWLHLSRLAAGPSRRSVVLLLLCGVSFAGLTSGAPLLGPVYAAAGVLAAVLLRRRELALGAVALAVGPVIAGIATVLGPRDVGAGDPEFPSAEMAFDFLLTDHRMLVLAGLLGLVLAVRLLPSPAAVLASCGSLAVMVSLLPGVFELVDAATGAGPIAWRFVTVMPLGVLVGLVAAVEPPDSWRLPVPSWVRTRAWVVPAAALAVVLAQDGKPLWDHPESGMASRPGWKAEPTAVSDVQRVTRLRTGPGPWLLPPVQMEVLASYTTGHFAVVPRWFYLTTLDEPPDALHARTLLYKVIAAEVPATRARAVRQALTLLDVALVCARAEDTQVVSLLESLTTRPLKQVGSMVCLVRRPPAS